jgi:hypothetical protein
VGYFLKQIKFGKNVRDRAGDWLYSTATDHLFAPTQRYRKNFVTIIHESSAKCSHNDQSTR